MINIAAKSGNLSPYLKATTQAVGASLKTATVPALSHSEEVVTKPGTATTNQSLNQLIPSGPLSVVSGVGIQTHVRWYRDNVQWPDFTPYRRDSTKNPNKQTANVEERATFTYLVSMGAVVATTYGAKAMVTQFLSSMSAAADVLALAKIEVNLNDIPEGKSVTFKWRGKPLFVRHRTGAEVAVEQAVPVSELRDPQQDSERVQQSQWLVVIGVCTHLGCVPIANSGDFGGYYCPCHGSHYDASGRIRKGPAPLNLEVPPYEISAENLLVVG